MRYLIAAAVLGLGGTSFADIINVPADYATIQAAVNAAVDGDEVVVAPGTYTGTGDEVVNMLGKTITLRASGTPGETIIDGEGQRRVVYCSSGEGADTLIEGFTITGGGHGSFGGGIYCSNSSPTISNCEISNNSGGEVGGGIYFGGDSSPTITNCTISNNTAGAGGGISCSFYSSPTITGCTISGNTANYDVGGGIWCYGSSPTLTDCTISNNTADDDGGGIYCSNSNPTLSGCTISDNTAADGGGISCGPYSSPTITGCTISGNTVNYDGGGISCHDDSSPTITGCEISDNTATNNGGGISCHDDSSPTITGCEISDNTATNNGGGIFCSSSSSPTLLNSTVCGNSPNQIVGSYSDYGGNTVTAICPSTGACCTNGECVIAEQADCLAFHGTWLGEGTTCDDSPCPTSCLGDVTGDGQVAVNDILTVIANWGPCP
jgi:parallel beta-helix repeat protein